MQSNTATLIAAGIVFVVPVMWLVSTFLWLRARRRANKSETVVRKLRERFQPIIDLDDEAARLGHEVQELRLAYAEKKTTYDRLMQELAIIDERYAFAELGVYEPHFDFSDSNEYKASVLAVRDQQKLMMSRKTAILTSGEWTVDGSASKGRTMANRAIRLTLRAFNNECDAAISNTRWNNVNAMEKRIVRAKDQIEKLNASIGLTIDSEFLRLKLNELYLTHEYREKLKQEKDIRAEEARLAREEKRLARDLEKAEAAEAHYEKLLARARREAAGIVGDQLSAFTEQIEMLERDLAEAHAATERAKALAERTRTGWVYIISNLGSFGEGVVKIGLTRRLDPMDRVKELGDASVPFTFDVHALIYSEDAPALETGLHETFKDARINAQNYRKEFFRVSLDEVERAVQSLAPEATFFRDVEAQEYRETMWRRQQELEVPTLSVASPAFPAEI